MLSGAGLSSYNQSTRLDLISKIIMVVLPLTFGTLFFLVNENIGDKEITRLLFALLGPLLIFFTLGLIVFKYLPIGNIDTIKTVLGFTMVLSILGVYFALTLNTRSLQLVSLLVSSNYVELDAGILLLTAVLVPIIEEFVKIFPAIIFARHVGSKDRSSLFKHPTLLLLIVVLGGATFNLLETYFYIWNAAQSYQSFLDDEIWSVVQYQVMLRSINPLHLTTALISGLGIIQALNSSTSPILDKSNVFTFLPNYFIAVVIHGLWNGYFVVYPDVKTYYQLPLFHWGLLSLCIVIFGWIIYYYSNLRFFNCDYCNNWHVPSLNHETPPLVGSTENITQNMYVCQNCGVEFNGHSCPNCGTIEVFSCDNCSYPLPIYARNCWKCGVTIKPFYDNLSHLQPYSSNQFIIVFYFLFALMSIIQIVYLLTNDLLLNKFANFGNQMIIFLIVSLALGGGVYLNRSKTYRFWGLIIDHYIMGLTLFTLSLLFLQFTILYLFLGLSIAGLLLLFPFGLMVFTGLKVIIPPTIYMRVDYV